jgi:diaminopimelate epimerase
MTQNADTMGSDFAFRFTKMHGVGNDFIVIDGRGGRLPLAGDAVRLLADRHVGIGFDQLLLIGRSDDPSCAASYTIRNADGSTSRQCGNGVRCIAAWLARDGTAGVGSVRLESPAGPVACELLDNGRVRVDMGEPDFAPAHIPLDIAEEADAYRIDVAGREVVIGAVSMGNPHAVVEVDDVAGAPVESLGAQIEHGAAFPEGCNVGFAQRHARDAIALRVWERGVGETRGCGTGACAAVAVLRRRGQVDARVGVALPGGRLDIEWPGPGRTLWMTGPATFVYEGTFDGRLDR